MKSNRISLLLGALLVAALVAVAWQAVILSRLRAGLAEARRELRHTLAVVLGTDPMPGLQQAQVERLELIQLRHQTRELRESLADARMARQGGWKELLSPMRSAAPMKLRPEWQAMGSHASNVYAGAMRGATNGTNAHLRYLSLHTAAKMSFALGYKEDAKRFAEDSMTLDAKYSQGAPAKINGDIVHDSNVILGRLAAEEGRLEDAKRHLLAAGRTKGSSILSSFGPNMGLAKDLLERGEHAAVLEYLLQCGKFWGEKDKLAEWSQDVEAGRIPQFGANLLY